MSRVCRILGALLLALLHPALALTTLAQSSGDPSGDDPEPPGVVRQQRQGTNSIQTGTAASPLTLEEAIERTRRQNPRVAAALLTAEAAEHRTEQAGKWPNPQASVYQETFPGALPDTDQTFLTVSQRIRVGGQLGLRASAAASLERAARSDSGAVREELTLAVQRTYAQVYRTQESLAAIETARRAVADLLRDLEFRLAEGDVSRFDVLRMRLEDESLLAQESQMRAEQRAGWSYLSALTATPIPNGGWQLESPLAGTGGPPGLEGTEILPDGESNQRSPDPQQLISRLENRFDLRAASYRQEAAGVRAQLVSKEVIPDLTVTLGYTRLDPALDGLAWSVGVEIPLLDRKRGARAAEEAEAQRLEREYRALLQEAQADAQAAWEEYREATEATRIFDEERQAPEDLISIARTAYEEGEMTVTELLDAARSQLDARLRRVMLEYRRADSWFRWRWASGRYVGEEDR